MVSKKRLLSSEQSIGLFVRGNLYGSYCILVSLVAELMVCLTVTPIPEFRVQPSPPFTHTGVDFAGPLYVKMTGVQENGKVWICLYTCCAVRAVHLDLVPDMTAEAFI